MTRPSLVLTTLTPCYRNVHVFKRRLKTTDAHHASSSSPPPLPSIFRNPLQWYITKLDTHPFTTKCITSGIISGSGDLLCQYLIKRNSSNTTTNEKDGRVTAVNNENKVTETDNDYDFIRTIRFTILGSFLVAPTVHKWYGFLMSSIPGSSIGAIAKRLFCDQGLFAPIFTPTFISCLTVLEHVIPDGKRSDGSGGVEEKKDSALNDQRNDLYTHLTTRLVNDVPDAIVVGWQLWIPSMAFMFACVPSKFQVLYSNGVGFVWNAYLSWKTHEGERNMGEDE